MDRPTIEVYERRAADWHERREPVQNERAMAFGRRATTSPVEGPIADLGCGPGWFTADLGQGVIALDGARAMLDLVPEHAPDALCVQADLAALPFRRGSLRAAWASKSYVHVARTAMPRALADLHRTLGVGAPVEFLLFGGDREHDPYEDDDFPGRRFSEWQVDHLANIVIGAGFALDVIDAIKGSKGNTQLVVEATRARTLPDTVGPNMRVLVCGLNPSIYAADAGVGFARPGNRFWPAALAAGLVTRDRDPFHALDAHGVGMTDLVKRASPRAEVLTTDEYASGLARVGRLVEWLQPGAVCFVGLAGWRAAIDRHAKPGVQQRRLGGRPVYLMPSTSGANATGTLDVLTAHLLAAAELGES